MSQAARKAFVQEHSLLTFPAHQWEHEFGKCKGHFVRLANPSEPFDMVESVLDTFVSAVVQSAIPYEQVFQHCCTVHKAEQDEILIWRFPIKAGTFPAPVKSPPAAGDKSLRWLHWGSQESILGLLLAGSIWPSSREGIGMMQENDFPLGFFCRVQESDHTPASMAAMATQLYWHGKNVAGIGAMGRWDGWYHKATCANTHIEQRAFDIMSASDLLRKMAGTVCGPTVHPLTPSFWQPKSPCICSHGADINQMKERCHISHARPFRMYRHAEFHPSLCTVDLRAAQK